MRSTFDRVKAILINILDVIEEQITMESRVGADLGADSLDDVEIIMDLETEFGVEIMDDWNDIKTVSDIVALVDRKLSA